MEKILITKSMSSKINSEVLTDDFLYKVEHEVMDGSLIRLSCSINKEGSSVGYMYYNDGYININIKEEYETQPHEEVFRKVIVEIKEELSAKNEGEALSA